MILLDELRKYGAAGIYPMHMPGHKRNRELMPEVDMYGADFTEIEGLDSLYNAKGILGDAMSKAARLYESENTFFLINGSSCGILAAVSACARRDGMGKVLMARNCHQSVYNALCLMELDAVYIQPAPDDAFGISGSIDPEDVRKALREHEDIGLIIITSPTYEGVISDIEAIAKLAHEKKIPLLVDEAHGAHLRFMPGGLRDSIEAGADIVVHGLHKTLPSPTQTALLHVNGELVSVEKIRNKLAVFQTSSPSYPLMAGIDYCIEMLLERSGELFERYTGLLNAFSVKMKALRHLNILCKGRDEAAKHPEIYKFDPGKIVISAGSSGMTGNEIGEALLKKHKIQIEMTMGGYAVAMTGIADTSEGFDRLASALLDIDSDQRDGPSVRSNAFCRLPDKIMPIFRAENEMKRLIAFDRSSGYICGEYVYSYPPGVPLIVPGELITDGVIDALEAMRMRSVTLVSTSGAMPGEIKVLC